MQNKTLAELIADRTLVDNELRHKTNLFWWGMVEDHRLYNSWMLYEDNLIESFHEKLDEEAIRDGSELYHEYISEKRIVVRMEGSVIIQDEDYNVTILKESAEHEPDEKLWQLYCELYPGSQVRPEEVD